MKTRTKTRTIPKTPFFAAFSVGAVLFSAHAGGGFATGNQANTYYVGLGWAGIVSAIVAMLLLTLTMREAMIMYNSRGLTSYKQLFETLYHPFDKIEWLFEIFFYIMVLMAVAAAISGAASALRSYFGVNYYLGVVAVGCLVLLLTIFGAGIVCAASTYMGIAILVTAITIYAVGIFKSESPLFTVLSADFQTTGFANVPKAIFNAFTYAGFQCVTLPTMIACGTTMRSKQGCAKAMWISFAMNAAGAQRHRVRVHHHFVHVHLHGRPHEHHQVRLWLLRLSRHRGRGRSVPDRRRVQKPQVYPRARSCAGLCRRAAGG